MSEPAPATEPLTYASSGVDGAKADAAVAALKPIAASTYRAEVLSDIGAFASLTALPSGYEEPVLVAANDGAGTKPLIAAALGRFDTIGIDVVAMCVDDLATFGAEPLLFQDQITMGEVDADIVEQLVVGLAAGCKSAGCALTGGEIAEHPGEMAAGAFDICGFAVGVIERARIPAQLSGEPAALIGLGSPSLRCNGYSLARRALLGPVEAAAAELTEALSRPAWDGADHSLGDELLTPSVIYAPAVREMFRAGAALGAAHITGGGIAANLARILSPTADAVIWRGSWPCPRIFDEITKRGPVAEAEMEAVFNLGVGMIVAVSAEPEQARTASCASTAQTAIEIANAHGHEAWAIGEIRPGSGQVHFEDGSL